MTCTKCGNQNIDWASYCTQCGAPLGLICDCSFLNSQENIFCGGCGMSLKDTQSKKTKTTVNDDSFVPQLNRKQISDLIQESIYFKGGSKEKLDQSDIDNIFVQDEEINE